MQTLHYKIYPLDRDITKLWFIEYKDPSTGKRLKKYGNLKNCSSLREKLIEVDRLVAAIKEDLELTPSKTNPYPGLDIPRLVQLKFEERSIYLKLKSISTYRTKVIEFVKWYRLNAHKPEAVSMGIGVAFIKHLKESNRSNTTVNAYRNTLKTIFRSLRKVIPENPFEDTQKLKERRKSYQYFDEDLQKELREILINENPELWLACQCQYYLLLRPNELRTIKVGSFNLRSAHVRVEGDISKNQNTQSITIPDEFIKQLAFVYDYPPQFYLFGKDGRPGLVPHTKKYFPDKHQALLKRHKIDVRDYKFYSWKHTGAVMYYLATGDVKGLKEQGRWHSLDMVNEYLKNLGILDIARVRQNFPKIGSQIIRPGS
jgi:hypothetical protein